MKYEFYVMDNFDNLGPGFKDPNAKRGTTGNNDGCGCVLIYCMVPLLLLWFVLSNSSQGEPPRRARATPTRTPTAIVQKSVPTRIPTPDAGINTAQEAWQHCDDAYNAEIARKNDDSDEQYPFYDPEYMRDLCMEQVDDSLPDRRVELEIEKYQLHMKEKNAQEEYQQYLERFDDGLRDDLDYADIYDFEYDD